MTCKELIFCCCFCGLPKYKQIDADRITHGVCPACFVIKVTELKEEMEKSDGRQPDNT